MGIKFSYKKLLDTSSNAIVTTDSKGKICFLNVRAKNLFKSYNKMKIGSFLPDVIPISGSLAMKCLSSGQPQLGQHIHGKHLKLILNADPIVDKDQVLGVFCSFQEMQEFEHAASKLKTYKRLNSQLETIFNSSSDGIWVFDGTGMVIAVNKAGEKLDGIVADEVIGASVFELIKSGVFDGAVVREVLKTKRKVTNLSDSIKTQKTYLCTGTPVLDENGSIALVVVNQRDMTELNTLREQLEENRMMAEKMREELAELNLTYAGENEIIVESEEYKQILRVALKLARLGASNILILGESGTGKGLLSKFIHENSTRKTKPFIQINCAAIPESLLEAELFGYEKGAFTGAKEQGKAGLFELANEGTLFLDEIGDLPFSVQAKLLKYLDDHEVLRLGGTKPKKLDCTIIAATNRDLETLCSERKFREDLYFRLNTFMVKIPPLRKRSEDIFALANYFLHKYNKSYKQKRILTRAAIDIFQTYAFPGNVRELKNIIEKAVVISETDILDAHILFNPDQLIQNTELLPLKKQLMKTEKAILSKAFLQHKTTRAMAKHLGIDQSSVVRKLKKHGLTVSGIR